MIDVHLFCNLPVLGTPFADGSPQRVNVPGNVRRSRAGFGSQQILVDLRDLGSQRVLQTAQLAQALSQPVCLSLAQLFAKSVVEFGKIGEVRIKMFLVLSERDQVVPVVALAAAAPGTAYPRHLAGFAADPLRCFDTLREGYALVIRGCHHILRGISCRPVHPGAAQIPMQGSSSALRKRQRRGS